MNCFISEETWQEGSPVNLGSEESYHLARVLRLKEGETVILLNGKGVKARAMIECSSIHQSVLKIVAIEKIQNISSIHLCFAIPKPAALEFILKRCTEIGVASFQPLETEHSLRLKSWNNKRWEKVLWEVCKQSQNPFFPVLNPPQRFSDWISGRREERTLLFCDEEQREGMSQNPEINVQVEILVGSEGGWSQSERELCREQKAVLFGLGKNRLRAEMAALTATILIKKYLGEL